MKYVLKRKQSVGLAFSRAGTVGAGATGTGMYLGGDTFGNGGIMHCYIAEFCIFTTAFTPTQVKNLNSYFRWKYALP